MLCMSEQQPTTPPAKTRFVTRAFVLLFIINFLSMGSFVMLYATMAGKINILIFLICGVLFNIVAARLGVEDDE